MLEYRFEPKSVEGMTGHVIVLVPSVKQRLLLSKEVAAKSDSETGDIDRIINIFDKVPQYIKEIDLDINGMKFKDLDSLGYYDFGMTVCVEIAKTILDGIQLGKK